MTTARRKMLSELIIAAVLCAAAQLALVDPTRHAAREAEEAVARARSEFAASAAPTASGDLNARAALARRLEAISAPSRDRTILFAEVSRMAATREITLDRLDSTPARVATAPAANPVWTYSLEVAGDFADVTRFIRDLEHELALVRLHDVRLIPADPERPGSTNLRLRFQVLDVAALASAPEPLEPQP